MVTSYAKLKLSLVLVSLMALITVNIQAQCLPARVANPFLFCHSYKSYVEEFDVMVVTLTTKDDWQKYQKLSEFTASQRSQLEVYSQQLNMYESDENSFELFVTKEIKEHYKDFQRLGFTHDESFQQWCDIHLQ